MGSGAGRPGGPGFFTLELPLLLILIWGVRNSSQSSTSSSELDGFELEQAAVSISGGSTEIVEDRFPWIPSSSGIPYWNRLARSPDERKALRSCASRLKHLLLAVCDGDVVEDVGYECCLKTCGLKDIRKYCGKGQEGPSTQISNSNDEAPDPNQMNAPDQDLLPPKTCQVIQVCSTRLRDKLREVCFGNFHTPNGGQGMGQVEKRFEIPQNGTFLFRRVPRAVVDDCCYKSCCLEDMRKYCGNGYLPPIPEPEPALIQLFKVPAQAIPKENHHGARDGRRRLQEREEEEEAGSGRNAFTSPLPPFMIRLGRQMNYY